jgi:predicted RNase H-like HicB family nuclease
MLKYLHGPHQTAVVPLTMKDLQPEIHVHALWDDEAHVFVATSEDVPGLVTEASTLEALVTKLQAMIPELLHLNDGLEAGSHVPAAVSLITERAFQICA